MPIEQVTVQRMHEALSFTSEAIMRTSSQDELFQRVCEAAVEGSRFKGAGIVMPVGVDTLRYVAGHGRDGMPSLAGAPAASLARGQESSRGLLGTAYLTGVPQLSNDYLNDDRFGAWKALGEMWGIRATASVPILRNGRSAGVLVFYLDEPHSITEEILGLMVKMAANIAFAMGNFDRERMFAALAATNEAIMRSRTAKEMYEAVCHAASYGGETLGAAVFMHDPATRRFAHKASAGKLAGFISTLRLSSDPESEYGGLSATAFRNAEPLFVEDAATDPRLLPARELCARHGIDGGAILPMMRGGVPVGLFLFFMEHAAGRIDAETSKLMVRIVDNVSFSLDMFDRDAARERIKSMFGALSATNEAIIRARDREELFRMVCDAAVVGGKFNCTAAEELFRMVCDAAVVGGKFNCTAVLMADPAGDRMKVVAAKGHGVELLTAGTYSVSAASPNGQGITGQAFRTGLPAVSNDYGTDARGAAFHAAARRGQAKSGAALPLMCGGGPAGVLLFMSGERGVYTGEVVGLMERMARNVSYALDNFVKDEERVAADERIRYLATHDALTALPNRAMFSHFLDNSIRKSERHGRRLAVMFIDLDRFKVINDTLGHSSGDLLLTEISGRIRSSVRASDVVARLGGDEFVVVLDEVGDVEDVARVAKSVLAAIGRPLQLSGQECRATASIGIAMYPEDGDDEQTLTKHADMAMYVAKEEGKNGHRFFAATMKSQSIERLMMENGLRHALEHEQFVVHYQPKVDLASGRIAGVEALIRWQHPDLGLVSPLQFIPLAEETGLIVPIGRWVLREACRQNMEWIAAGMPAVSMAVNLSPRQFGDENLLSDIDAALTDSGMPAKLLQLEVTESMVMQNPDRAIATLREIKSRGAQLAIDDFGTGYSSMSQLKRFPIDTIKIDRAFIKDLPTSNEDVAIANAIIQMGKALGMTIVAEGVETVEQRSFLSDRSCDQMQGYLFSRPLTPGAMQMLMSAQPDHAPLQPEMPDQALAAEIGSDHLHAPVWAA